ncbi:hypothetical protein N658DRAFT_568008 [Parathielavia hyrcaniae]|uniref:RING-type E3 ubiquitin transferase n=1 Tax=Parathielavia hyrcaniae TaxID=113614 RepID=A0AAN6PXM6_9PEZI|nr:hypothetical protein N658DRAFT_568008 [Parathielavia hyrcaniae]
MARLKMAQWDNAIADCAECLRLAPDSMKAHYSLSQAHLALHAYDDALRHALRAHVLCAGAGDKSLGTITTHVLRCKKERWDDLEKRRARETAGLEAEVLALLERERDGALREHRQGRLDLDEVAKKEIEDEWRGKMDMMRDVFERARPAEERRRQVPDWAIDDISFQVMVDPVIWLSRQKPASPTSGPPSSSISAGSPRTRSRGNRFSGLPENASPIRRPKPAVLRTLL